MVTINKDSKRVQIIADAIRVLAAEGKTIPEIVVATGYSDSNIQAYARTFDIAIPGYVRRAPRGAPKPAPAAIDPLDMPLVNMVKFRKLARDRAEAEGITYERAAIIEFLELQREVLLDGHEDHSD